MMFEAKNHFIKHLLFWMGLLLFFVVLAPALLGKPTYSMSNTEREYFTSIGVDTNQAEKRAFNTFKGLFIDTGIRSTLNKFFKPTVSVDKNYGSGSVAPSQNQAFGRMGEISSKYIDGFWATLYKGLIRIHILWPIMLSVLLCLGIPCLIDGIVARTKKNYNFAYHNPVYFWTSGHSVVIVLGMSILLPFLPFSITMLAVTAFSVILCGSIWLLASNFQTGV
jgi:hypothetical protein